MAFSAIANGLYTKLYANLLKTSIAFGAINRISCSIHVPVRETLTGICRIAGNQSWHGVRPVLNIFRKYKRSTRATDDPSDDLASAGGPMLRHTRTHPQNRPGDNYKPQKNEGMGIAKFLIDSVLGNFEQVLKPRH